ncbi:MAG TPA: phosphoglucosamine mutase [Gemmatimonadales bacterium]|nr:phosphoglucosamine mutase [Gemmatimonadales bacterium]
MSDTLMVGVSGVRGIVGKDLTAEVVLRWAEAFGRTRREAGGGKDDAGVVVLGRDARQSGPEFARAAAQGLTRAGCDVIDVGLVPTPTVQLAVLHHRAAGGIIITASHNPIEWNSLKFVGADGIFLDTEAGARVAELEKKPAGGTRGSGSAKADQGAVARHLERVLALPVIDSARIRKRKFQVALDCVRGAGGVIMPELLQGLGCEVTGINLETDGRFPRAPEPIPENLDALSDLVRSSGADLGMAVDPDVDRLALVDETGTPIGEDYTLAFAVRAVCGSGNVVRRTMRRLRSRPVVCNLSTSLVVEDAARDCGAKVIRTPVGEVHVARELVRRGAEIGGEGNGGVMYAPLHAGRDAPAGAALVLELLAREGKKVSELVRASPRYVIVKAKVERGADLERAYAALRARFPDAAADAQDGLRLAWPDRWLHVRPSNTEPIVRFIAEGPTAAAAQDLIKEGRRLCAGS